MKKISIQYYTTPSHRPNWLLHFTGEVRSYFNEVKDGEELVALENISRVLDEHHYYQRKLKRSCSTIERRIRDEKMDIYSSTGKRVIATIEFY